MRFAFLSFIFITLINSTFAFNWKECRKVGPGEAGLVTSSTQATSSWGPCSLFGTTSEQERELFYVINWEFIKRDIAKGEGENLSSLLALSGCKDTNDLVLRKYLKQNYEEMFNDDMERSYRFITPILDGHCSREPNKTSS